jgi:hypothetical protein
VDHHLDDPQPVNPQTDHPHRDDPQLMSSDSEEEDIQVTPQNLNRLKLKVFVHKHITNK